MESVSPNEEFLDPNMNYRILLTELRERLQNLQHDIEAIQDQEVKGLATQIYTDLKIQYFKLLRDDLYLQEKFSTQQIYEDILTTIKGDINE
jgi:tyrosine-protein phosphatase YwqE